MTGTLARYFGMRFLTTLVAVLLGMTIVPAVLVLLVGSEVIRNSVDRWFNAPMNDVLSAANAIAGDYYAEQQRRVSGQAQRAAAALESADLEPRDYSGRGMYGRRCVGVVVDAKPNAVGFYERYLKGEKLKTGWVNPTDFEKQPLD